MESARVFSRSSWGRASEPATSTKTSPSGTSWSVVKGIGAAQGFPLGAARALLAGGSAPTRPSNPGPSTNTPASGRCSSGAEVMTLGPDVAVPAPSGTPTTMAGFSPFPAEEQAGRAPPPNATAAAARPARMRCELAMTVSSQLRPAFEG
jgi:hypothetical protein